MNSNRRLGGIFFWAYPSRVLFLFLVFLLVPQESFAALGIPVTYSVGSSPRSVFAIELNGVAGVDVAVANYNSNTVSVLLNQGNGIFATAVNYAVGSRPANLFAADLDGDNDADIVAANFVSDNVSVLLNNGDGTFAAAVNYASGDGAWSVFAADLDGDNDRDLAVTNSNAATFSVLLNNGNGTFASPVTYAVQTVPASVWAIDFDGDSDLDVAVANYFGATVSFLRNNGNGTFAAAVHYEVGNWSTSQWNYPIAISAGDLDGDGDADIATANYDNNQVSILFNNGNGIFGASVEYAVGSRPPSIFIADMDADGDRDLVTANYFGGTVSILPNNGNGTFGTRVDYAAGSGPWSVFAADVDRDSDLDLAVANYDNAKVAILLSDLSIPLEPPPSAIAPLINLRQVPSPLSLPDGPGEVIYTYKVTNPGRVTMTDITLIDDKCPAVTFVGGDTNNNTWLETNEEWTYHCTVNLSVTTLNYATVRGVGNGLASVDSAIVNVFVGEPIVPPIIHLVKLAEPPKLPMGGGSVTYSYTVTNPGTETLHDIAVTGDACTDVRYIGGDLNANSLLESNETWVYRCTETILETTISTAVVTGDANGLTAIDPSIAMVLVFNSLVPNTAGPYSVAETFTDSPNINFDKALVLPVGGVPVACTSGELIKLADDGDQETQTDAAVYYCGEDGKRYVFPDFGTYHSWYPDFSEVVTVSEAQLRSIPLGTNVTYRPGASLVKVPSGSKVYAVAKGGVLRWVADEITARALYGPDWTNLVKDISESLFINYTVGPAVTLIDVVPGTLPVSASPVSPPSAPHSECTSATTFTKFLSFGSVDPEVRPLQELLRCLGYFPADVAQTGHFGSVTEGAVKKFQSANGIEPAGYVGPATRERLNRY